MDLCCEYPFPGFTINNEAATGEDAIVDALVLAENGIVGLDGPPIRRQVQPRGKTDGGLVHTSYLAARTVAWSGKVLINSTDWTLSTEYLTAVNTLMDTVMAGLESIRNADWTLTWTPTGVATRSLVLRYGLPGGEIQFGGTMLDLTWAFQTISADPEIG